MIKAAILDDELNSIETLQWKLNNFCPQVQIIQTFSDPVQALTWLNKAQIDILFLDIEMPKMSGFDLLDALGEVRFDVIFTTAYDNYGIQAVKFSALDYLLKPVRNKELIEAIERHVNKSTGHAPAIQIASLLQNLKAEALTGKPEKITLATKESPRIGGPLRNHIL